VNESICIGNNYMWIKFEYIVFDRIVNDAKIWMVKNRMNEITI